MSFAQESGHPIRRKLRDYATQPEWLQWFRNNVDLGEMHERQLELYRKEFEKETGKLCPERS